MFRVTAPVIGLYLTIVPGVDVVKLVNTEPPWVDDPGYIGTFVAAFIAIRL